MSVYDRIPIERQIPLEHCVGEAETLRIAARRAEDDGDFQGALRLVHRLPVEIDAERWRRQLVLAITLPASGAELSRWLIHSALRWALERPAGQLLEAYAQLMLTLLGVRASGREAEVTEVAATDPVVVDAGLFDGGLFARYLSSLLGSTLLARAGPVSDWTGCPASVWELECQRADGALLRDCWTGEQVKAVTTRESVEAPAGALLYGRLVPVTGPVGLAFAISPVVVDRRCAVRICRARQRESGPEERIRAVAHSRRRLEAG